MSYNNKIEQTVCERKGFRLIYSPGIGYSVSGAQGFKGEIIVHVSYKDNENPTPEELEYRLFLYSKGTFVTGTPQATKMARTLVDASEALIVFEKYLNNKE